MIKVSGFGGLVVSMLAPVPKIADSNPAEDLGFFSGKKIPSEGK
jgi:hypothetical protein